MSTTAALVNLTTTQNVGALQTYATDGAYVAANGAAGNGSAYYNTTDNEIHAYESGAWVVIPSAISAQGILANQVFS